MKKVILILLPFLFFNNVNAQETAVIANHDVTFKLKITDLAITDSVGIGWFIEPNVENQTVVNSDGKIVNEQYYFNASILPN
jgi:hypothetical protein